MSVDWKALNNKTSSYRTLQALPDTAGKVGGVVFCGLRANLSEIVSRFTFGAGTTLTIFADSLVVDSPSFLASGVVVVARSIDVSMLKGDAIPVRVPAAGAMAVTELLVKECVGGSLQLTTSEAVAGTPTFHAPTGDDPLQAVYYSIDGKGAVTTSVQSNPADIQDLLGRVWALNSLKASLTAALWLMDSSDAQDLATARSMLRWVVSCVRTLGAGGAAVPADYAELLSNAAALLITIDLAPGAYYVPVLSSRFYGGQTDALLNTLVRYESNLATLDVQSGIQQAVASVGATLEAATQDEIAPLQTQLDNIKQNLAGLNKDILALSAELQAQQISADIRLDVLTAKITSQRILQTVEAAFTMVANVVKAGAAVGGDKKEPGKALEALVEVVKNAKKLADIAAKDTPNRELLQRATELMQMQQQLMTAFVTGMALWNQPQNGAISAKLPETFSSDQADPGLAWDNYMVEAERELTDIKEDIGTGTGASGAQEAANKYLATLKIMAQYGKALDAKYLVAASQMAQGTVVNAQIRAAQTTQARWKQLEANAQSDQERLAALKGIIQMRMDSVKRALFAAWVNYRNSYFYLYFQEPPRVIKMDMNAADLSAAFASVGAWVASLYGDTPTARQVRLPDDNVQITYRFKIVRQDDTAKYGTDTALLTARSGNVPASLTWVIPSADSQMAGVLPNGGQVAIWIKEAKFFLEGVAPNAKGNVIAAISTSGAYQNGFGPQTSYNFVTKGMVGNFAYRAVGEKVYNSWSINTEVYSTPTPFTQWKMAFDADGGDPGNAAWLRIELVVAYRGRGDLAKRATP